MILILIYSFLNNNNDYFVAPSVIVEDFDDGFLHSEVGIDKDLERLLAEDPGLYMENVSNATNKSQNGPNNNAVLSTPPSMDTNTSINPKRSDTHRTLSYSISSSH